MKNSGVEFNKLTKEEKIAAEDILMTNWIKEIDPEVTLQDVNSITIFFRDYPYAF